MSQTVYRWCDKHQQDHPCQSEPGEPLYQKAASGQWLYLHGGTVEGECAGPVPPWEPARRCFCGRAVLPLPEQADAPSDEDWAAFRGREIRPPRIILTVPL